MAGAVVYLDVDDEITSAAARIRGATTSPVAVVIPPGSRIATSRINFRLLAREALEQGRRLAIVAPDAASRALAASAGLPVFGSVGEFESAAGGSAAVRTGDFAGADAGVTRVPVDADEEGTILIPPEPDEGQREAGRPAEIPGSNGAVGRDASLGSAAAAAGAAGVGAASAGVVASGVASVGPREVDRGVARGRPGSADGGGDVPVSRRGGDVPVSRGRDVRRSRRWSGVVPLVGAVVALAVLAAAVAAYVVLPSATVVVTPRYEPVGPISFTVKADPAAADVDPGAAVIPAQRLSFDLSADGTFQATGQDVEETPATGVIRWTNCDPTASYRIPAGAVVRTKAGIRFATTEPVFLPVAGIGGGSPPTLQCQSNTAGIKAVAPGPEANVDAGSITVPPSNYNANVIRVTNPDPTTGGDRQTFAKVAKKDVDAAQAALRQELDDELDAKLAEPGAVPTGLTTFPTTRTYSAPVPTVDPATLVNQRMDTFDLGITAQASVVAVDESPLQQLATKRLGASVKTDHTLRQDSIQVSVGNPSAATDVVSFPVTVSAVQVANLDPATLRRAILGRSLDDARRALAAYGAVEISTWPGWVGSIPTIEQRVDVQIAPPASGTGGPSSSPQSSGHPSARPAASSSADAESPSPS